MSDDRGESSTPVSKSVMTPRRIISFVVSVAIVVGIFVWAIPKFADYGAVWSSIQTLTPIEFASLFAIMLFNLLTYWWANQAALPGLGLGQAAVLTQTTTSVANTMPAGGAIAVGLTYSILNSWGFSGTDVALYVAVTGVWNIFVKLALPVVGLALLAASGELTSAYQIAAVIGVLTLGVAVGLLVLLFRSEHLARRIGDALARPISFVRRLLHKPPVTDGGERAAQFRRDTISLVEGRWLRLSLTTLLSQVTLYIVLLMSLRHMGVSESEVSASAVFAVFAFSRLLSAVPITPGAAGIIDLGYVGGLTALADGMDAQIVAAVLLFRLLTFGVQIPLGAFTYLIWRAKKSWRQPEAAPVKATPSVTTA
jgi:putative heme transporter